MTPQDAITVIENTSKLCKDIGTKGLATELLEVIKVIRDLEYDIFMKNERHQNVHEQHCMHVLSLEKKIWKLEAEIAIKGQKSL